MRSKTDPRPKATRPHTSPSEVSGLIAKSHRAPRSARAKPALDDRSHRTFRASESARHFVSRFRSLRDEEPCSQAPLAHRAGFSGAAAGRAGGGPVLSEGHCTLRREQALALSCYVSIRHTRK